MGGRIAANGRWVRVAGRRHPRPWAACIPTLAYSLEVRATHVRLLFLNEWRRTGAARRRDMHLCDAWRASPRPSPVKDGRGRRRLLSACAQGRDDGPEKHPLLRTWVDEAVAADALRRVVIDRLAAFARALHRLAPGHRQQRRDQGCADDHRRFLPASAANRAGSPSHTMRACSRTYTRSACGRAKVTFCSPRSTVIGVVLRRRSSA